MIDTIVKENNARYFSIIIPLYNKVNYIERSVQSVLNQIYPHFEILIINDGSTDGSEKKIQSFCDKRIVYINQRNQGVSVARNNGVNNSKYNFVAFLDADDTWEPNFLLELNTLIDLYPLSGIFGINHFSYYNSGKITHENYNWLFKGKTSGIINDYFKIFAKLGKSPFSNSGCCFPKDIFLSVGGYKPGVKTTEDSELWCRIALNFDIAFYTQPLATYYLETPNNTRMIIEYEDFQVSTTLKKLINDNQVPEMYIQSVNDLIAFQQLSLVKRAILTGNNKFAVKKLVDKNLILNNPFSAFTLFFIALTPYRLFLFFRQLVKKLC